jgi:hypothetical protein
MAAAVVVLAGQIAISRFAPHASRRVLGQWGGAGGAICDHHLALARSLDKSRRMFVKNPFCPRRRARARDMQYRSVR